MCVCVHSGGEKVNEEETRRQIDSHCASARGKDKRGSKACGRLTRTRTEKVHRKLLIYRQSGCCVNVRFFFSFLGIGEKNYGHPHGFDAKPNENASNAIGVIVNVRRVLIVKIFIF